jgi:hypothetical protein
MLYQLFSWYFVIFFKDQLGFHMLRCRLAETLGIDTFAKLILKELNQRFRALEPA